MWNFFRRKRAELEEEPKPEPKAELKPVYEYLDVPEPEPSLYHWVTVRPMPYGCFILSLVRNGDEENTSCGRMKISISPHGDPQCEFYDSRTQQQHVFHELNACLDFLDANHLPSLDLNPILIGGLRKVIRDQITQLTRRHWRPGQPLKVDSPIDLP